MQIVQMFNLRKFSKRFQNKLRQSKQIDQENILNENEKHFVCLYMYVSFKSR